MIVVAEGCHILDKEKENKNIGEIMMNEMEDYFFKHNININVKFFNACLVSQSSHANSLDQKKCSALS